MTSWESSAYKAAGRPGAGRGTVPALSFERAPVARGKAQRPSNWIGVALMVANTAIALVDLFLLAGNIPH
ncbi:MAG: hypothetical protein ACLQVK_26505 [Acidimicrobiales bacterium]|jgi:hypothetical protein